MRGPERGTRRRGDARGRAGARDAARPARTGAGRGLPVAMIVACFAAGLLCRLPVLGGEHREGDELVYRVLVRQLETGHGYTLRGTPLVGLHYAPEQYAGPLFFHPPGGVALFWLLHRLLREGGYPLAQLLSFAMFFACVMRIGQQVLDPFRGLRAVLVAALAALTPIAVHVNLRYWLDGPMLAVATLACSLFLAARTRRSLALAALAGVALGYASLIKLNAFFAVPGILLLAWAAGDGTARGFDWKLAAVFLGAAVVVQLPWEIWQWRETGSPFPAWAGKPAPQLIAVNAFVHMVTIERPPWIYLSLLPRAVWTLIPSIAGLALLPLPARSRRVGAALLGWILGIVAIQIGLGFVGYSKLLRYVILVTPACLLLFGLVASEAVTWLAAPVRAPRQRAFAMALVTAAAAGLALELAQGVAAAVVDDDYIHPLF